MQVADTIKDTKARLNGKEAQNLTVLIVDDDPFNRDILKHLLRQEGFKTESFDHAVGAWQYLESGKDGHIILLDRMMPLMNGMDFIKKTKNDPRFCDIPIIMVSAAAERSQVNEGKQSGVYEYLTKPFRGKDLIAMVYHAMRHVNTDKKPH